MRLNKYHFGREYICKWCPAKFLQKERLDSHMLEGNHLIKFFCQCCHQMLDFRSIQSIQKHVSVRTSRMGHRATCKSPLSREWISSGTNLDKIKKEIIAIGLKKGEEEMWKNYLEQERLQIMNNQEEERERQRREAEEAEAVEAEQERQAEEEEELQILCGVNTALKRALKAAAAEATLPVASPKDEGLCAVALYDYQAEDEDEISFDCNDIISNIQKLKIGSNIQKPPTFVGYWFGKCKGKFGLFPANYVDLKK